MRAIGGTVAAVTLAAVLVWPAPSLSQDKPVLLVPGPSGTGTSAADENAPGTPEETEPKEGQRVTQGIEVDSLGGRASENFGIIPATSYAKRRQLSDGL